MDQKPQFSVLLSFQNQRDEVEPSLTALYELEHIPFELIVIDDNSTDGTGQAIHSLIDYYQHDYTFFFDHTETTGRGNCLNEALLQASTTIIWAPWAIESINEDLLRAAIKKLKNGAATCLTQNVSLPTNLPGLVNAIDTGKLPKDGQILWNNANIPLYQQFFNPFLNRYHGIEQMLRLGMDALEMSDTFFTLPDFESSTNPSPAEQQELIMTLLRRPGIARRNRESLFEFLNDLPPITETISAQDDDLLAKAVRLKLEGQLGAALACVEEILEDKPGDPEAKRLKIKLLEKKRRFVEASELKHEMQTDSEPKEVHHTLAEQSAKTSIIIPTALYGKAALEHCLIAINEHCSADTTELIIIDNASLDDTHTYLNELKEKNFFNCHIITNQTNQGFSASINQGLKTANGQYACIMHNDVELNGPVISQLEQLMDNHPGYALLGPLADSTLNPDQLISNADLYHSEVVETDYLDSFCMMMRTEAALKMDEKYSLAFFDDIDLCFEARNNGYKVGIAPEVHLTHHYGTSTFAIDLDTESELYWRNIAYFNEKWDIQTYSPEDLQSKGRFEQLLTLDEWVNPLYPEAAIKQKFTELFTDEVKTEILNTTHDAETLMHLIHLMMVMEKRDIMRRLEDRAENIDLPATLIYEIVRFYFDRNVYSRCEYYLRRLNSQQESLQSDLYRLAMLIDEKKIEKAIPMLTQLLDRAPSNPLLYKLAGDIHQFENNNEEAASFYSLAHQINPFDFTETQKEIRLNS